MQCTQSPTDTLGWFDSGTSFGDKGTVLDIMGLFNMFGRKCYIYTSNMLIKKIMNVLVNNFLS